MRKPSKLESIVFVTPLISYPRYNKRISALSKYFNSTKSVYFSRNYLSGPTPHCESVKIGELDVRNYYVRVLLLIKALPSIRKNTKNSDVLYAFGLDMVLLAFISSMGRKQIIVYEVADIRSIMIGTGIVSIAIRAIERLITKKIKKIVVTSDVFIEEYFEPIQNITRADLFAVIENKVNFPLKTIDKTIKKKNYGPIVIGYFGMIRCLRSWEILNKLATDNPEQFEVVIFGKIRIASIIEQSSMPNNIKFYGEYNWPDDLENIYGTVDVVWACYPFSEESIGNWQWAKTNRFYESCAFQKTLITQNGSADSKLVTAYKLGVIVDLGNIEQCVSTLRDTLSWEYISRCSDQLEKLPKNIYQYEDEHKILYDDLLK